MDNKEDSPIKTSSSKTEPDESPKENKVKVRGRKRKRLENDSDSDESLLPENTLEFEKSLKASAIKNNLDDTSVKKILKKVVTNDHVLALVKLREEEEAENECCGVEPKRTRSKMKELMKVDPDRAQWPIELSPIIEIPVKTRPEVKALIAQELPEDEDDEEYQPTHDDVLSDDDQTLESCSDLDSQPRTPATPQMVSPCVVRDGPFKVPQDTPVRRKLLIGEEEATIALRTRSKLSLSHTPIEHIESSFVPPDDIPTPAVDDLWSEFLNGVLNPEGPRHDEDDDADPEYNVAADPDANEEDEALGKIFKISKKELNDLMTELLHVMPETEDISDVLVRNVLNEEPNNQMSNHWQGKQEPLSDNENEGQASMLKEKRNSLTRLSIGKSEKEDPDYEGNSNEVDKDRDNRNEIADRGVNKSQNKVDISIEEESHSVEPATIQAVPPRLLRELVTTSHTTYITVDNNVKFLPEQIQLLEQQLRQHIQLATSNFLQLYINPTHWAKAPTFKEYLEQLHKIYKSNPKSVVNVCNLVPAVELVESWEKSVSADTPENKGMVEFIHKEEERCRRRFASNGLYIGDFPETFKRVIANSTVFLYPYLLPPRPYRADNARRFSYRLSEDALIALGLDQFWKFVYDNPQVYRPPSKTHAKRRWGMNYTLQLICKYLLPWATPRSLWCHINKSRKENDNPIAKFFDKCTVEPMKHKLLPFGPNLTLYEQPEHEMPRIWIRYLAQSSRRFKDYLYKGKYSGLPPAEGVTINIGEIIQTPTKTALPIDFTKTIVSNRINVRMKTPIVHTPDKYDINVVGQDENIPQNVIVVGNTGTNTQRPIAVESNGNIVGKLIPVNTIWTPNSSTGDRTSIVNRRAIDINNLVLTPEMSRSHDKNNILPQTPNVNNTFKTPKSSGNKVTVSNGKIILECTPNINTIDQEDKYTIIYEDSISDMSNTSVTINKIENRDLNTEDQSNNMDSANTIDTVVSMSNNTNATSTNKIISSPQALDRYSNGPARQHIFNLVTTSTGMALVPISTVNSTNTNVSENLQLRKTIDENHCKCCLLLHKIDKQKKITDFFKHDNDQEKLNTCDCSNRVYQKISKRLKLLINNFKTKSWCVYRAIVSKIIDNNQLGDGVNRKKDEQYDLYDIATVNSYQMKFIMRTGMCRDIYMKRKVYSCVSQFDLDTDDPLKLDKLLFKHFGVDFVDLYKEFIMFLTPYQADKIGRFKDYFVLSIVENLVKKIEEEIKDKDNRIELLHLIKNMTYDNNSSSCEMCSILLSKMFGYPKVAKYVFELFPHRSRQMGDEESPKTDEDAPQLNGKGSEEPEKFPLVPEPATDMEHYYVEESLVINYEADDSSSEEDTQNQTLTPSPETHNGTENGRVNPNDSNKVFDTPELTISKTEVPEYDSATDMSMLMMSDDETTVKSEPPEWKRDDDKHILESLMKHLKTQDKKESILEIIEEKNICKMLSESLADKSIDDIRNRVMYLLNILVVNDFKQ